MPVKNSLDFVEEIKQNLDKINSPILIQHSKKDSVCDYSGSQTIYNKISSDEKEIIFFERSDHVLLADYDKEEVYQWEHPIKDRKKNFNKEIDKLVSDFSFPLIYKQGVWFLFYDFYY